MKIKFLSFFLLACLLYSSLAMDITDTNNNYIYNGTVTLYNVNFAFPTNVPINGYTLKINGIGTASTNYYWSNPDQGYITNGQPSLAVGSLTTTASIVSIGGVATTIPGTWSTAAGLLTNSINQAVAVFSNGVYSMAGIIRASYVKQTNCYVYNGTNWTSIAGLPTALESPAAGVLGDKMYVLGGQNPSADNETNVFAYNGATWTSVAGLPTRRMNLTAATLDDKLYAIGGYGSPPAGAKTNVYAYNGTNWTEVASLPDPRQLLAAATLNGKIYAIGGKDSSSVAQTNVYAYDGATWTSVAGLPAARGEIGAATLNGKIYVVCGKGTAITNDVYCFDGTTWTSVANTPELRRNSAAAAAYNGKIYSVGGWDASNNGSTNVYAYTPDSESKNPIQTWKDASGKIIAQLYTNKMVMVGPFITTNSIP